MSYPIISADSHITEHPDTYTKHIDRAFRDRAPHVVATQDHGDVFVIDGMDRPIHLGLVAAAGKLPEEITESGVKFEDLHRERGLGDAAGVCGASEVQVPGDRVEVTELFDRDRIHKRA